MTQTTCCNREHQQVALLHPGDQIFENCIGGGGCTEACRTYVGKDKFIRGSVERLLEKTLRVDSRIILKRVLKKQDGNVRARLTWAGIRNDKL